MGGRTAAVVFCEERTDLRGKGGCGGNHRGGFPLAPVEQADPGAAERVRMTWIISS